MTITINPITVDTDNGPVICTSASVSVAVSASTAIRLVPVDAAGNEYPNAAFGIVGDPSVPDVAEFIEAVRTAVTTLVQTRGL